MRKLQVKHSESKDAWNIIGTIPGDKYKIARLPYTIQKCMSEEYNHRQKQEAYKDAILISKAPEMLEMLKDIVKAWGALPAGNNTVKQTQDWIVNELHPQIVKSRELIKEATNV